MDSINYSGPKLFFFFVFLKKCRDPCPPCSSIKSDVPGKDTNLHRSWYCFSRLSFSSSRRLSSCLSCFSEESRTLTSCRWAFRSAWDRFLRCVSCSTRTVRISTYTDKRTDFFFKPECVTFSTTVTKLVLKTKVCGQQII